MVIEMIYAIWNTIFVNNHSLRGFKVPRGIFDVELREEDVVSVNDGKEDIDILSICSPRSTNNSGEVFYLSCDNVSWIYALDTVDFMEELTFLTSYGLRIGRDLVMVNVEGSRNLIRDCNWLDIIERNKNFWKLNVVSKNLYNGLNIRAIKK